MTSIFGMLGVDLTAPDHTTLSRRGQHLALALRRARPGTSLHLIVDSTGLSIVGDGEWAAAKHGVGARIPRPRCATIDLLAIVATAGE